MIAYLQVSIAVVFTSWRIGAAAGYGFPFPSPMPGQFLLKDVVLLGVAPERHIWKGSPQASSAVAGKRRRAPRSTTQPPARADGQRSSRHASKLRCTAVIASAATQTHTSQGNCWGNTTHSPYITLVSPASVSAGVNWNVRSVRLT